MTLTIINPRLFLHDEHVDPWEQDQNVDLLASDTPVVATGKYVCFDYTVPKGQVVVVHGMSMYAKQRINVGAADESNEMIQPVDGNGWFAFEPQVNDSSPYIVGLSFAAPRLAGGTLNNSDRQRARGISQISLNPREDANKQWYNALYSFLCPSESRLRVIFSLLPAARTNGLTSGSGSYAISTTATKRVDYAGAFIVGQQMSAQHYNQIAAEVRAEGRGRK